MTQLELDAVTIRYPVQCCPATGCDTLVFTEVNSDTLRWFACCVFRSEFRWMTDRDESVYQFCKSSHH